MPGHSASKTRVNALVAIAPEENAMLTRATLALLAVLITAWPARTQEQTVTVFAAASLKNALDDIIAAYGRNFGRKVVASYAASSALAKQIEEGAPADVFVSADKEWMDYAAQKKFIVPKSRINLLGNRLVLIAPKDSKLDEVKIGPGFDIAKLAGDGRIAARRLGRGREQACSDGKRARRAGAGRPRRSAARHRLRDRRQDRAECEDRRPVSRQFASADRLPGGADRKCEAGWREVLRVPQLGHRAGVLRAPRLHLSGESGTVIRSV
jgi:hypothetical protein